MIRQRLTRRRFLALSGGGAAALAVGAGLAPVDTGPATLAEVVADDVLPATVIEMGQTVTVATQRDVWVTWPCGENITRGTIVAMDRDGLATIARDGLPVIGVAV